MVLTVQEVVDRVFPQEFRGYDRGAVDAFLDQVADTITELSAQSAPAPAPAPAPALPAPSNPMGVQDESLIARALVAAQRTADETVEEARRAAEEATASAREEAERMLDDARAEAARTLEEAQDQASEHVMAAREQASAEREEARVGAERIRQVLGDFARFREEYRERIAGVVAEQMALLERVDDQLDPPPGQPELAQAAEELSAGPVGGVVPTDLEYRAPAAAPPGPGGSTPASAFGDLDQPTREFSVLDVDLPDGVNVR